MNLFKFHTMVVVAAGLCLPMSAASEEVTNLWIFRYKGSSDSTPAIGKDGTIYFGTFHGKFYAVNPDGKEKWDFTAGNEVHTAPAIAEDGTIYFGCRDRKFYALSDSGNKKWDFKTRAWVDSSPAIGSDGIVYFGSWDHNLYALNNEGKKLWLFPTAGPVVSSPAIGTNNVIYFGSHDGNLYALTTEGKKIWEFKTAGPIVSSPALDWDGNIYFTSGDGYLYSLRGDATVRWKYQGNTTRQGSPVIGLNGMVFQSGSQALWALSPDGKRQWERGWGDNDCTPAILADGSVIFMGRSGEVINYDHNRQHRWIHYIFPVGTASPAIGPTGTIYQQGEDVQGLVAIPWNSPLAPTPWPKFRGNARNTGNLRDAPQ